MDAHTALADERRSGATISLYLFEIDERQPLLDRRAIRNRVVLIVIEFPDVGERTEGDVELAAGPDAGLACRVEHLDGFAADRHRSDPRLPVEPDDVAAVFPHAQQRVEAIEFAKSMLE